MHIKHCCNTQVAAQLATIELNKKNVTYIQCGAVFNVT